MTVSQSNNVEHILCVCSPSNVYQRQSSLSEFRRMMVKFQHLIKLCCDFILKAPLNCLSTLIIPHLLICYLLYCFYIVLFLFLQFFVLFGFFLFCFFPDKMQITSFLAIQSRIYNSFLKKVHIYNLIIKSTINNNV